MVITNTGYSSANESFQIIEIGKPDENIQNYWGPGVRDHYMIHFCTEGEGVFNGKKVHKGEYFLTTPYTKIHYYPDPNNPWQYIWINFTGKDALAVMASYGFITETGVAKYHFCDELTNAMKLTFSGTKQLKMSTNESVTSWAKLLFSMNTVFVKPTKRTEDVKKLHVNNAIEFINTNYHKKISPSDVSEFMNLDEKYLCSLFKKIIGVPVQTYLNNLRIEKAKLLLSFSELNVSEVAYSIGIDDPLYFSKCFKKTVGVSPREYKKTATPPPSKFLLLN